MLEEYLDLVHAEALDQAGTYEAGGLRLNVIAAVLLDHLEDSGAVSAGQNSYYRHDGASKAAEVHAYAYDSDDEVLSLFYCIDPNTNTSLGSPDGVRTVTKAEIDRGIRRLVAFLNLARASEVADIDESQPVHDLLKLIGDLRPQKSTIELHILALGNVSDKAVQSSKVSGMACEVWDIVRLARACGRFGHDRLSIDFVKEFGQALPCLITPGTSEGIQVILSSIPGQVLADIYNKYRARLLERNVRSFLQFSGKVNKGIRGTILHEPGRFLPYNNGLAATAAYADIEDLGGGLGRIRAVHDFQVVNGGQTTASIASCVRRDKADVSEVSVAMKLTVVPEEYVDNLVPLISKHANTQNRVQEADFSANHPWHIQLEKLSRNTWTKPNSNAPRGTRWFYERSRGQYKDEMSTNATTSAKKRWRIENPSSQKFVKTDLAKYVLSWEQNPAAVSRGAQKCFVEFMGRLTNERRGVPTVDDFQRIVALGILFRRTEKLYGEMGYQGYRANVVTYAIARLSFSLQKQIPWREIWESQMLPSYLEVALKKVIIGVRDVIVAPPGNRNITEWCKKTECWSAVLKLEFDVEVPIASTTTEENAEAVQAEAPIIECISCVPSAVWFAVAKWAKDTSSLQPWQRSLAFSLGKLATQERRPSFKQSIQGRKLLIEACDLGYAHDDLTEQVLAKIVSGEK